MDGSSRSPSAWPASPRWPRSRARLTTPRSCRNSRFLRELGVGWAFVGAEVPLQCGDREFFADSSTTAAYRYVVLELKLGRFHPSHVGQLNFYVQLVDDKLRNHTENDPTLGILLVVDRDDVTVEVALRGITSPLAVTEWRRLPSDLRRALPTPQSPNRNRNPHSPRNRIRSLTWLT